ncbi:MULTISPECIES: DUF418 domain-containing protein [unclassified Planococcus (in: firmicutes)]|uniref:DUF418 domain-containing protein n=1 Tax=Planococcus TaxID=1372 RepID=UPI000C32EA63|nr:MULTISPECIES: DUF418 domain-containing protein [unclassified Planococcus (in: firmicutes)]AUD14281.1 hypothetical protein CW734_12350 [Planococcus sp. MB-3u-03]PKG48323.1 hypothetical protein CXF66_02635 [Planococcus sp. Urea-trap-24]PKG92170.1 hypothetical protein CXF91_02185 [Planococcus sp. Urea-3u-39]PKH42924.1 hypothetical protein CXF77_00830 [Planococcus sp. MB-3u-09]
MKLQPISLRERVDAIDLMRGFSLFGILLINMLAFHTPLSYIDPYKWFSGNMDQTIFTGLDIFVQASFYPLFSMLFGYGLMMQFLRAQDYGQPFMPVAVKRLLILLAFGIVHAFLIWYGDILITYALMGLLLIGMLRLSPAWLLGLGVLLYTLPHLMFTVIMFLAVMVDPNIYIGYQEAEQSVAAYQSGNFAEIFSRRLTDWYYVNNPFSFIILTVTILPLMMIGAAAAKWRMIEQAAAKKKTWLMLAVGSLTVGLLLKSTPYLFDKNYAYQYVQEMFGGPLVSIGYAGIIALLSLNLKFMKALSPLVKAGRMSMTIYITQSIIATSIFYSFGLGLYGQVDLLTGTLIAVGIFVVQLIFAELWFSKFKRGPIEMVWRRWTYGNNFEKSNNSKR